MQKNHRAVSVKLVVIGRSGVGKTSMINTFQQTQRNASGQLLSAKTGHELYHCQVDGNEISLLIQDSVEGEKDHRIRALSYMDADVFLLLFDVNSCEENLMKPQWWVELKHYCPNVPVIVVGSKSDLRDNQKTKTLSSEKGAALADSIGAVKYMEMSTFDVESVRKVFEEACKAGYRFQTLKGGSYDKLCLLI